MANAQHHFGFVSPARLTIARSEDGTVWEWRASRLIDRGRHRGAVYDVVHTSPDLTPGDLRIALASRDFYVVEVPGRLADVARSLIAAQTDAKRRLPVWTPVGVDEDRERVYDLLTRLLWKESTTK